jgi:hypothetical protein
MLQTDQQFPSIGSQKARVVVNPDTSVDVYFGPKAPPGKESNWVQISPGKGWNVMLRLYGPLEPWFDKTWRPGQPASQDPLHRCAWKPTLSYLHHLKEEQLRRRRATGHATLG